MALKAPSESQIKFLYQITVKLVEKIKAHESDYKDKSLPVYIGLGIALVILAGCIFWYVWQKDLAPLMIYMALLIPVLSFGIAEQSRHIQQLKKEFTEYNDSIDNFLKSISSLDEDTLTNEEKALGVVMAAFISSDEKTVDDLTYGEIKQLPQYKNALTYAINLAAVESSIDDMLEEEEDVGDILSTLDTDPIDPGTYFDDQGGLYEAVTGNKNTTTTETSTQKNDEMKSDS